MRRLSPEFQRILQESADESVTHQRQLWREMVAEALAEFERTGITILDPDKEPFRQAVEGFWAEFEGTEIDTLAKRVQAVK